MYARPLHPSWILLVRVLVAVPLLAPSGVVVDPPSRSFLGYAAGPDLWKRCCWPQWQDLML